MLGVGSKETEPLQQAGSEYRLWDAFDPAGRTHYRYSIINEDTYTPVEPIYCAGRFVGYTDGVLRGIDSDGQAEIRQALSAWESVSGVTFEEVAWDPDLSDTAVEIVFGWQSPADSDGRGGLVGTAVILKSLNDPCGWPYQFEGNETAIYFDPLDFRWDFGSSSYGTPTQAERNDFYNTALHEIGHAIGIGHSNVTGTVMSGDDGEPGTGTPYTVYGGQRATLTADDIAAAVALYGPAATATPPPGVPPGTGTQYTNTVIGTPGEDRLYGGPGNDVMTGGAGRDLLAGGPGNDLLLGGHEGATLFGQGGADVFVYTGGRNWFMDFDAAQGDRIAGLSRDALNTGTADGSIRVQQSGEHYAIYWGDTPFGDDANVIWLANTAPGDGYPGYEWFLV